MKSFKTSQNSYFWLQCPFIILTTRIILTTDFYQNPKQSYAMNANANYNKTQQKTTHWACPALEPRVKVLKKKKTMCQKDNVKNLMQPCECQLILNREKDTTRRTSDTIEWPFRFSVSLPEPCNFYFIFFRNCIVPSSHIPLCIILLPTSVLIYYVSASVVCFI